MLAAAALAGAVLAPTAAADSPLCPGEVATPPLSPPATPNDAVNRVLREYVGTIDGVDVCLDSEGRGCPGDRAVAVCSGAWGSESGGEGTCDGFEATSRERYDGAEIRPIDLVVYHRFFNYCSPTYSYHGQEFGSSYTFTSVYWSGSGLSCRIFVVADAAVINKSVVVPCALLPPPVTPVLP